MSKQICVSLHKEWLAVSFVHGTDAVDRKISAGTVARKRQLVSEDIKMNWLKLTVISGERKRRGQHFTSVATRRRRRKSSALVCRGCWWNVRESSSNLCLFLRIKRDPAWITPSAGNSHFICFITPVSSCWQREKGQWSRTSSWLRFWGMSWTLVLFQDGDKVVS
jgi:hypothetical protein